MNATIVEQIIRLVPAVIAMAVFSAFTVLKIMKDYAPFMFTPIVIMMALSVGIDQASHVASAEDHGDDVTHIYVSGGSMSEPYYQFYSDSEGTTEISELDISHSYTFHRLNEATSHPFYVSDTGYEQESSDKVTITGDGSSSSGITGSETFTISFEEGLPVDDTLSFFCTVHSSMYSDFSLTETTDLPDIPTTAQSTGVHDSLVAAVIQADLLTTLQGEGPFTVFAPTDQAFADAGINLSSLDNDEGKSILSDILLYHVLSGSVQSSEVTDGLTATAVNGDILTFAVGDSVMVNDATVTTPDVMASNGVIHVIDKVLIPPADLENIPTVAQSTGIHNSLVSALIHANLVGALSGEGPYTVFAPTDAAFEEFGLNLSDFDTEAENETLAKILSYHVAMGSVMSSSITNGMEVNSLIQEPISVSVFNGSVILNGEALVTQPDVMTSNGVIHVINKVLMPPSMSPQGPPGEICYDMETHTIDVTKTEETCEKMWTPSVDIPTTAAATTIHTALVAALDKANLVETLKGEGPFTVFAPTDEAFTAEGINLDDYDTDEKISALADILLMHVVSGKVMSSNLTDGMEATALSGDVLKFTVGDAVLVNGATVTIADVPVSNGVIHVIDKVLMPVKEEEPKAEDKPSCDHIIGLDSTGYAYSPASLTIKVGETVCWQWTDSADLHNVAEISAEGDQMRKEGGIYSGETAKTVDFRHTFTEATTFHYICEPHVGMQMVGKVVVGESSTDSETTTPSVEKEEDTPGFGLALAAFAVIGIALISRRL